MHVLFRTDASPQIGTGHVMRCLALAEALRDTGVSITFVCKELTTALEQKLQENRCAVMRIQETLGDREDASRTVAIAKECAAEWIVTDGYEFDAAYMEKLKSGDSKLLCIDDEGVLEEYKANAIVNQNAYAGATLYQKKTDESVLMMGPRFALLRREFWPWQRFVKSTKKSAMHILVTLGGSDPKNVTTRVLEALKQVTVPIEVTIVVGSSNQNLAAIKTLASAVPYKAQLRENVSDMPALIAEADIAISGGGTTCYELAFLGLPILTIVLAENQTNNAKALEKAGVSQNLGPAEKLEDAALAKHVTSLLRNENGRIAMSTKGQELVDGEGSARVSQFLAGNRLRLRLAKTEDCKQVFTWANDPETRSVSFSTEPISWETHVEWFTASLTNPLRLFFIAVTAEDKPVGQIRFDSNGAGATLSISIDPACRGQGYGKELVLLGVRKAFSDTEIQAIHAYVKAENAASAKLFEGTGFSELPEETLKGQTARHYVLERGMLVV
jgi:UDP-2,4-diacetamido-2,4,6-trideoxy-beta-L-altropyranose hydrolase